MNEETVISDILAGNVNRYEEVVREYQDIVANLCYKIGGQRIDVQEMTQQVFVELYSALPRFKFQSKLSTFIYRLTVNVVCKELKRSSRLVTSQDDPNAPEVPSEDRNIEQAIVQDERYRKLYSAIGRLHVEQRTALVLYTFNNFSYNDIADVMQCSVAKVESLIFRARKNLKKLLEDDR